MKRQKGSNLEWGPGTAASRSDAEVSGDPGGRGRPGRRTGEERMQAVLQLLAGKATVDQLARRFGVLATTIEHWREEALGAVERAMRQGTSRSPEELELERKYSALQKAFTDMAIKQELVERALAARPSRPGKSSR
jgi:transposase-like protein